MTYITYKVSVDRLKELTGMNDFELGSFMLHLDETFFDNAIIDWANCVKHNTPAVDEPTQEQIMEFLYAKGCEYE